MIHAALEGPPSPLLERETDDPQAAERALVDAVRRGDREAAESLVQATYTSVYASLFKLCGDPDMASDLTQETYRKAWQAFGSFDRRSRFFTWLYRIAYTTFLNHLRSGKRWEALDPVQEVQLPDPDPRPDQRLEDRQEEQHLRAAVLALPDELRFTVSAHFWGELTVSEVAQLERITTVAIRKRLKKAYALLQDRLHGTER
ncbi:MAG TPA: sigma-70 family RNA polymerase sigma factor [Thermoanaerobaculia bacterium]|nr:sigma-70 family RNA polymerase sigma factor [Thermoanaerobaculia bacterium]